MPAAATSKGAIDLRSVHVAVSESLLSDRGPSDTDTHASQEVVAPASRPVATWWSRRKTTVPHGFFSGLSSRFGLHPVSIGVLAGISAVFMLALFLPGIGAKNVLAKAAPSIVASPSSNVSTRQPTSSAKPASAASLTPADHLVIASLGINAPVTVLGLVGGALDTPKTLWQVGRYIGASDPGATGTAIIVGHAGAPGQLGVFEHLSRLKVGATLTYRYLDGRVFIYQVTSSASYPDSAAGAQVLFAPTATPTLNLVSCYGAWNAKTREYAQRWIVTTTLVSSS